MSTAVTVAHLDSPVRFCGGDENLAGRLPGLHGMILDLQAPIVEHHRSDFFVDAHWIARHVTEPIVFFAGARDTGTSIGTDLDLVRYSNDKVWRVEVSRGRWDAWYVTITDATEDGAPTWHFDHCHPAPVSNRECQL